MSGYERALLPGLLAAAALVVAAPTAQAAIIPLTTAQLTDASDYVVRGTVSQMWVDTDDRGYHWTRVELEVEATYKGPADLDALRLDVMGGVLGTEGTMVVYTPRFDVGEEVLVFAEQLDSGLLVPTGMMQGKATVRIDPDNGREMLVRYNPPQERPYDHRFIPHPDLAVRIYLDDIVTQVRERDLAGWDGEPIPGKSMERLRQMHLQAPVEVNR